MEVSTRVHHKSLVATTTQNSNANAIDCTIVVRIRNVNFLLTATVHVRNSIRSHIKTSLILQIAEMELCDPEKLCGPINDM